MAAERLLRILGLLAATGTGEGRRLCEVAAEVTGMSGAGVMLLADGRPQASVCTTDTVSALIEELQYTFGEGPCVDAHHSGTVVAEPDLEAAGPHRWSAFSPPAVRAGARAVFGIPIRIGTVRLGALNLYRDRPGRLGDDQHADALVMADVTARALLASQAEAPAGRLPSELESDTDQWLVVHQAAGMVSIQLDVSVEDALVRLRAHAFGVDRPVTDIAREVVERRLRLDGDG
ncbi:MAG TPA: GAF and ANTAR domain-containing protein [Acidimicrobiales bacterium]|nr:GAF and ANTAR domain-containing protein [Acidimicrobiales bacterium]